MKNWVKFVISIVLPQVAGLSGALFTKTSPGTWYSNLAKPGWNPPGWVFGPVWTTLYILMGIAFYIIWKSDAPLDKKRPAMAFWILQLIFNFFWTLIFFDAQNLVGATIEIIALWLLILYTIILFARINKVAAWLLVPYIAWVTFAAYLTYSIWQLNS